MSSEIIKIAPSIIEAILAASAAPASYLLINNEIRREKIESEILSIGERIRIFSKIEPLGAYEMGLLPTNGRLRTLTKFVKHLADNKIIVIPDVLTDGKDNLSKKALRKSFKPRTSEWGTIRQDLRLPTSDGNGQVAITALDKSPQLLVFLLVTNKSPLPGFKLINKS